MEVKNIQKKHEHFKMIMYYIVEKKLSKISHKHLKNEAVEPII